MHWMSSEYSLATLVVMSSDSSRRSVQLIYLEVCSHWHTALGRLQEAIHRTGLDISVELQLVSSEDDASAHLMPGSPTIVVDGRDPFPGGAANWGCRLYESGGKLDGAPSVLDLVAAPS